MWGLLSVSTHGHHEIYTGNDQTPTGEPLGQIWGDDPAFGFLPVFWKVQNLLSQSGLGADRKEQLAGRSGHGCFQRRGQDGDRGASGPVGARFRAFPSRPRVMRSGQPVSVSADSREAPRPWQGAGWALSLQP